MNNEIFIVGEKVLIPIGDNLCIAFYNYENTVFVYKYIGHNLEKEFIYVNQMYKLSNVYEDKPISNGDNIIYSKNGILYEGIVYYKDNKLVVGSEFNEVNITKNNCYKVK